MAQTTVKNLLSLPNGMSLKMTKSGFGYKYHVDFCDHLKFDVLSINIYQFWGPDHDKMLISGRPALQNGDFLIFRPKNWLTRKKFLWKNYVFYA